MFLSAILFYNTRPDKTKCHDDDGVLFVLCLLPRKATEVITIQQHERESVIISQTDVMVLHSQE